MGKEGVAQWTHSPRIIFVTLFVGGLYLFVVVFIVSCVIAGGAGRVAVILCTKLLVDLSMVWCVVAGYGSNENSKIIWPAIGLFE